MVFLHAPPLAPQEDSLVAAHNAAHAAETAEEAALRRQQRAVQEAARAASRPPHLARKSSGAGSATLGRQASASASLGSDSAGGPSGGAGSKRSREAVIEQGGNGGPLGSPSGPVKRQNSMLAPHTQAQATAAALRKQHSLPPRRASGRLTSPSPAAGGAGLSPPPSHSSPGPSPFGRLAQQPRPHRLTLASPSPAPSCLSDVRESPRAGQGRASNDGSSGAGAGAGAGSVPPPRGPLAAPSARCASELSFRHPGMVVVQLVPGQGGGGAGAGPGACLSPSGRPLRLASPALEKPFVLCPARWTVAHVAQLLSQWLPPRGYGPSAARVPPSSVLLEPAPGLLRGRHRSLRGCTQLGVLAAEAEGEQTGAGAGTAQRGGGRGGAALSDYAGGVLVLHYSVVPGSPA
ncbi:hypothetical protein HYH03_004144 [Edaphochlamys debaryana]|uniref:Uncharacterized protein n=1 Tax=Edaphochlamys debaryana TaxID=47281 RepID=A0A836C3J1_9CHLO|nr:hypothetical protein HYH03_004144 [Edaphochlamys debaryana]|eukprot:KAG2497878.1 hypothetical protein HYH03_004144 [Edaphochlamys debaryana]